MTKPVAIQRAMAWSKRVDLPAYIYTSPSGWKWATDKTIANMASATVEIVDANPVRVGARTLGRIGGSSRTERKAAASRANGRKGGRPRTQL